MDYRYPHSYAMYMFITYINLIKYSNLDDIDSDLDKVVKKILI